ncbi:MAG TPA: preprotein translocase subunit SecE [Myxococcales bacterium]|jgi:preprotein translocase subunit SecE|nr:preprotein translocase subunit SecE [Myxococcales bacterium]
MTNTRIVVVGLIALALLSGLFLEHVLWEVFRAIPATHFMTTGIAGSDSWTPSTFVGLGIAFAAAAYAWMSEKARTVSHEIVGELRKVSWPSLPETRAATIAVIVASVIAAILLGVFDVFWQFLTDKIQNPSL